MSIFIISFLFIFTFILNLLSNSTYEIILYMISGILLYTIIIKEKNSKFKDYKKVITGLIIGYLVANIILINNEYKTTYNVRKNLGVTENRTAIILLFDMDLNNYNPAFLIKNFKDSNSLFNMYKLPINLYRQKITISKYGENMNMYYSQSILEQLQNKLGESSIIYGSYVNQSPYIEESIQEAIADGSKEVIIVPISLVGTEAIESHHDKIQEVRFNVENVEFKSTDYLWNSELIAQSYIHKINLNSKAIDKSRTGIILVGEKLNKKTEDNPYIKQDILFRKKVSNLLKKDGYDNNKVRLSFLDKDQVYEEIKKLMEYGVGEIIIVHVSNEAQKNSSLYTVENLVESLDAPQGIKFTQVYGWNPSEYLITELLKSIELVKYKSVK